MKFRIFNFKTVTSTNDVAINLIKKKNKRIGYVSAYIQTKGRGTHGKKWISRKGNLFGSLFFPLKKKFPPFNEFSVVNPIIISDVIKHFCKGSKIALKFPNDIFVNGKKVCGILQELITLKSEKFLIIGIGINVDKNPNISTKYKATNILKETKKKPQVDDIIKLIIFSYEKFFKNLKHYNYRNFKKKANFLAVS